MYEGIYSANNVLASDLGSFMHSLGKAGWYLSVWNLYIFEAFLELLNCHAAILKPRAWFKINGFTTFFCHFYKQETTFMTSILH